MATIEMLDGEEIPITQEQYDNINTILNDPSVLYIDVGTRNVRKNLIAQLKKTETKWKHKVTDEERAEEERKFQENVRRLGQNG